jgi:hypothetical protein
MNSYELFPGEGLPIDIAYSVDVHTWSVTAKLMNRLTGKEITGLPTISVSRVDNFTCRFHITAAITTALAGKQAMFKAIAIDPENPNEPVVDEAIVTVSAV